MDSNGDAYDNAVAESFFASLEKDLLRRSSFATRQEARTAVFDYIETFYNPIRLHSIDGSTAKAAELDDARWVELVQRHHALLRRQLDPFRGRELDTAGGGFFAILTGPFCAIRRACAIRDAVHELGLEARSGLHAGECELLEGKIGGIAVHIGAVSPHRQVSRRNRVKHRQGARRGIRRRFRGPRSYQVKGRTG
jgi:hypothetical protein